MHWILFIVLVKFWCVATRCVLYYIKYCYVTKYSLLSLCFVPKHNCPCKILIYLQVLVYIISLIKILLHYFYCFLFSPLKYSVITRNFFSFIVLLFRSITFYSLSSQNVDAFLSIDFGSLLLIEFCCILKRCFQFSLFAKCRRFWDLAFHSQSLQNVDSFSEFNSYTRVKCVPKNCILISTLRKYYSITKQCFLLCSYLYFWDIPKHCSLFSVFITFIYSQVCRSIVFVSMPSHNCISPIHFNFPFNFAWIRLPFVYRRLTEIYNYLIIFTLCKINETI